MPAPRYAVVLFRTAAFFALLAVIGGALVCATDSGFECGNWPGCTDRTLLPHDPVTELLYRNPWIEMAHRSSAVLAGPLALACAVVGLVRKDLHPLARVLPWVAVAGAGVAGFVGRGIVLGAVYPTWVGAADLLSALACMSSLIVAAVAVERTPAAWRPNRLAFDVWTAVAILAVSHACALWTAVTGSYTRCMGWPVWNMVEGDDPVLTVVRMALTIVALYFIGRAVTALRALPSERALGTTIAALAGVLLVLGVVIGWAHVASLGFLYSSLTAIMFAALVLAASRASLRVRRRGEDGFIPQGDVAEAVRS